MENSNNDNPYQSILEEEHVAPSAKISYGLASMGNNFLSGLGLGAINLFYLKTTSLEPSMMAWSWIFFMVWNAINDPLFGIIEDRTQSKLGRRIPYLRYGAPVYVLCFILVWYPTSVEHLLFWNHFLMLFIFDTIYTIIGLITYSLPAEMAITSKERANIVLWSAGFTAIAMVGTVVLPIYYLADPPDIEGFRRAVIILGFISGFCIWISSYYIKENAYAQMEESLGFMDSIKESFKNKPFLILEVSIFAMVIMQHMLTGNITFLIDYVMEINLDSWQSILAGIGAAGLLIYGLYWVYRSIEVKGLKTTVIQGSAVAIVGFVALLFIAINSDADQYNKLSLAEGVLPLALVFVGMLAYMLTNQALIGDTIDYDESRTGKRRETTYSGMNALITKPAVSIGHALFLFTLDAFGYIEGTEGQPAPGPLQQPASVAQGVILAFTVIPIVCLAIAILAMKFYPLDGREWLETKEKLQKIHQEKEKEFLAKIQAEETSDQQKPPSEESPPNS